MDWIWLRDFIGMFLIFTVSAVLVAVAVVGWVIAVKEYPLLTAGIGMVVGGGVIGYLFARDMKKDRRG